MKVYGQVVSVAIVAAISCFGLNPYAALADPCPGNPSLEVCDGVDNNCNGFIDDAPLADSPAPGQSGCWSLPGNCCSYGGFTWCPPAGASCGDNGVLPQPCNPGRLGCSGGAWSCGSFPSPEEKLPSAEVCDGIDNDCDGTVDDDPVGVGQQCGLDQGPCMPGVTACSGGMLYCDGAVTPSSEVCDGIDNDCDGVVDNGIAVVGQACGVDQAPCTPGVLVCVPGGLECQGGIMPQPDFCDGIDNDCNGSIDDSFPCSTATPSPTGTPAATPTASPQAASHDSVVLSGKPLTVSVKRGVTSKTGQLLVKVRNADRLPVPETPGHLILLTASSIDCPAGTIAGAPDFDKVTPGAQDAVLLAGGKSRSATLPLLISSAAFATVNDTAPRRCKISLTVSSPGHADPSPDNNITTVELNVIDKNDPD